MSRLVFLVGLSGSGKTTVGRILAGRLQLPFVDTDAEVERQAGKPVARIFQEEGEPRFRDLERAIIAEICQRTSAVVATGGGAPVDPENRRRMLSAGRAVWLDAPSKELHARIGPAAASRPKLHEAPLPALEQMRAERTVAYGACGPRVDTAGQTPAEVAGAIVQLLKHETGIFPSQVPGATPGPVWVHTSAHSYPIYLGPGLLEQLPGLLAEHGLDAPLLVLIDEVVDDLYGARLRDILGDRRRLWRRLPAGEEHKTLDHACRLYDDLLQVRPERNDVIVAVGGGVVGDLAGFVAATLLRGLRFVQIPTTVLSQVDSSVGGKVGVDHPRGKNLIGAFYQPNLVMADLDLLHSLPARQVAAGWAEVVKIAVAQDGALFEEVEGNPGALSRLDSEAAGAAIRRAIELKARLVEQDERDLLGLRALLNYGHTLGHAIEAATSYGRYLHGETVAMGMTAAARIATWLELHPAAAVQRQDALLRSLGLPRAPEGVSRGALMEAIGLDKKRQAGRVEWVLPRGLGAAQAGVAVPDELVERAVDWLLEGGSR